VVYSLFLVKSLLEPILARLDIMAQLEEGVEMNAENFPQFYNPEEHLSTCANPDKLFRFCDCPH
jgi:hypothetical protein